MSVKFWRRPLSGRSAIVAKNVVATSQPLAVNAGLDIMKKGGNAVDAAVAVSSVLNVVEPYSTGIGGDAFALLSIPGEKEPIAINGSGFSPENLTLKYLTEELNLTEMPLSGVLPITVPGTVSAWEKLIEKYGNLSLDEILKPAIHYAENGFHVSPLIAQVWKLFNKFESDYPNLAKVYLPAPKVGDLAKNVNLAETFKIIGKEGAAAFYKGDISNNIVEFMEKNKGFISNKDLSNYEAEWTKPISKEIFGHKLWQHGPNGQGLITILILALAETLKINSFKRDSSEYLHRLVESKKMAFIDGENYICDPKFNEIPIDELLSEKYPKERILDFSSQALDKYPNSINFGEDTVYATTADSSGMAVSLINSLFYGFGSFMVDKNTGICFQNRGAGFSFSGKNIYEPKKRPFHTIIPAMITDMDNQLEYSFGVMGGHHQPQGQAQVYLNLIVHGLDPQEAISAPRFHHNQKENILSIEEPLYELIGKQLQQKGHQIVEPKGVNFGGGQIIKFDKRNNCFIAGSDPRKDGQASGY